MKYTKEDDLFSINTTEAQVVGAVRDTMNISAAASLLGLPKTTLSSILSKLERKLKNQIFIRKQGSGEVIVTPFGQEVIPKLERMLWIADSIRPRDQSDYSKHNVGNISIISNQTILEAFICPYLSEFLDENPELRLTLTQKDTDYFHQPATNDIFIGLWEYNTDNYLYLPFHNFEPRIWASQDYINRVGPIESTDDLAKCRFVLWQKMASPEHYPGNDFLVRRLGISLNSPNIIYVRTGPRLLDVIAEQGGAIMMASEETTRLNQLNVVPLMPDVRGETVSLFVKVEKKFIESPLAKFVTDWIFSCRNRALQSIGIDPAASYTPFFTPSDLERIKELEKKKKA